MFRRVELPAWISGRLLLHSMPGRFEAIERVWHQLGSEAVGAIVCFNEEYEIRLKSSKYAEALEAGTVPCSVMPFEIREGGVPEDRGAFLGACERCSESIAVRGSSAYSLRWRCRPHRDACHLGAARLGRADHRGGKRSLAGRIHGGKQCRRSKCFPGARRALRPGPVGIDVKLGHRFKVQEPRWGPTFSY